MRMHALHHELPGDAKHTHTHSLSLSLSLSLTHTHTHTHTHMYILCRWAPADANAVDNQLSGDGSGDLWSENL
jgi:hypothetical protein